MVLLSTLILTLFNRKYVELVLAFCVVHFIAHLILMTNRYYEFRSINVKTAPTPQPSDDNIQIMQLEEPGEGSKRSRNYKEIR